MSFLGYKNLPAKYKSSKWYGTVDGMFGTRKRLVTVDKEKITELLTRGVEEIISYDKLKEALLSGKKLRVKLGIDPTSPNLHLGRSIPLLKMRDFQELGHTVVLIIGDFTGVIGDTSDKETERTMLDSDTIERNKKTYFDQLGKVIDVDNAELRYNSQWLEKLTYREIGEHADQFSVADFIARDNIKRRLNAGKRVSLRETLYPLLQGYDSVAINADVEIGGVDQRFNLLAGRTLQSHFGKQPQDIVMTTFPLQGLDGRKMSSSWGNTINFTDEPSDMYGKVMSVRDVLVDDYFVLCTRVSTREIERMKREREAKTLHPRDMKMRLARDIVTIYHGEEWAERAEKNFTDTFGKKGMPEDVEEVVVEAGTLLVDVLLDRAVVTSKNEFRKLIAKGAITDMATGEKVDDVHAVVGRHADFKIGKRRFLKVRLVK